MKKIGNFLLKVFIVIVWIFAIYFCSQMFYDAFILKYGSEMRLYTFAFMVILLGGTSLLTYSVFNARDKS